MRLKTRSMTQVFKHKQNKTQTESVEQKNVKNYDFILLNDRTLKMVVFASHYARSLSSISLLIHPYFTETLKSTGILTSENTHRKNAQKSSVSKYGF